MKRVIIVRHAKAEPFGYENDFYRDLTVRGISDAVKISLHLKDLGVFPELVIASPANRAMHTATVYCQNLGYPEESIRQENVLYDGLTTQSFVHLLHKLSETVQTVFVFGHNPTVHSLVYNLATDFYSDMATCATVALDFDVDHWQEVSARQAIIAFQFSPKSF